MSRIDGLNRRIWTVDRTYAWSQDEFISIIHGYSRVRFWFLKTYEDGIFDVFYLSLKAPSLNLLSNEWTPPQVIATLQKSNQMHKTLWDKLVTTKSMNPCLSCLYRTKLNELVISTLCIVEIKYLWSLSNKYLWERSNWNWKTAKERKWSPGNSYRHE